MGQDYYLYLSQDKNSISNCRQDGCLRILWKMTFMKKGYPSFN